RLICSLKMLAGRQPNGNGGLLWRHAITLAVRMPFLQHGRLLLPDHDAVLFLASIAHQSQINSLDWTVLEIDGVGTVAVKDLDSRRGVGHLNVLTPLRPHLAGQEHLLFSGRGGFAMTVPAKPLSK